MSEVPGVDEEVPVVLVACELEFAPAAAAPAFGSVVVLFWSIVELLDDVEDCGTAVVPPAFGVVEASGVAVVAGVVLVVELLPAVLELVWSLTAGEDVVDAGPLCGVPAAVWFPAVFELPLLPALVVVVAVVPA